MEMKTGQQRLAEEMLKLAEVAAGTCRIFPQLAEEATLDLFRLRNKYAAILQVEETITAISNILYGKNRSK